MGDYRRVDDSGGWLEVRRIMTVHGARCAIAVGGQPFFVDPLEIDEHARAMYEAAGVPSPVTLERPDLGPTPRTHLFRGLDVYRSADDGVTFAIGGNRETLSASLVRQMAAVAVALADAGEPDQAEVDALESVLREASGRHDPDDTMTGIARAILAAGYRREAAS
jgi:hypothetical protein